jgi:hypothetical protein
MAQINGGTVTFKRSFQPEQYGSRGAEVALSFTIFEGEELGDMLDRAGALARDKVMELVYAKAPVGAKAVVADLPAPKHEKASPAVEAIAAAVVVADKVEGKEQAAAKLNAKDVAMKKTLAKVAKAVGATPAAAPAEDPFAEPKANISTGEERVDNLDDVLGVEGPVITPKDLQDAVTKKHATFGRGQEIRAVVNKYVTHPATVKEIPVDKRAAFIAEIEALFK